MLPSTDRISCGGKWSKCKLQKRILERMKRKLSLSGSTMRDEGLSFSEKGLQCIKKWKNKTENETSAEIRLRLNGLGENDA